MGDIWTWLFGEENDFEENEETTFLESVNEYINSAIRQLFKSWFDIVRKEEQRLYKMKQKQESERDFITYLSATLATLIVILISAYYVYKNKTKIFAKSKSEKFVPSNEVKEVIPIQPSPPSIKTEVEEQIQTGPIENKPEEKRSSVTPEEIRSKVTKEIIDTERFVFHDSFTPSKYPRN